ncbi:GNAT family N-acetyltransferase [Ketogulonicigenium vulgare]|uniref:N-acetyltransferase n=1 Tax=Ketogulonicigenium vulgare (strain WSH-001) TaxID=759362 RepID=F9Y7T0_KETVW|nr:GNAT family N-acetyltransferase [Ketogulonicigenium vulgare]ADO41659.1 conserved hypothetical protein [Ketogulonicigenium vulgare Y25]AEM39896.1 hypothetical protein KVU_0057 [Ketogulonicigenium vulgare WSH-001]ALJ80113.1 hypothetical protein KVH_02320 [Ketogulonicigenium vulgare]ANW32982.1 hypothetical protein KvSKV_02320 [Ketogulonicigenium vulgare]AOZ53590.1 hypothetical protein KVC_0565 [Ketogulonicigenium vulgare]
MSDIALKTHDSIAAIGAADWDACANPSGAARARDPFTTYRFLNALEESGSVGGRSGWQPLYLQALRNGKTVGVSPLYVKSHSQGEYVFDFGWADAWQRAGGQYYPKLQIAVPFTPATGRRFLTDDPEVMAALTAGAVQLAAQNDLSSLHITFCTEDEAAAGSQMGLLHRIGTQFHWQNNGYRDFDAFLAALSSRKRKTLRRERAEALDFGGEIVSLTGDQLQPAHWDAFWAFYQDTGARKWGQPYLTRAFFEICQRDLRDDVLMVLALRDGRPIAGALNFIGAGALYGRYWGALENHPFLHFELCYYRAIDFAIAQGLPLVEAGAQGEHKLARGYLPRPTHSLHWIADPGFRAAVADFVQAETAAVDEEIEVLTTYGPFRRDGQEREPE